MWQHCFAQNLTSWTATSPPFECSASFFNILCFIHKSTCMKPQTTYTAGDEDFRCEHSLEHGETIYNLTSTLFVICLEIRRKQDYILISIYFEQKHQIALNLDCAPQSGELCFQIWAGRIARALYLLKGTAPREKNQFEVFHLTFFHVSRRRFSENGHFLRPSSQFLSSILIIAI